MDWKIQQTHCGVGNHLLCACVDSVDCVDAQVCMFWSVDLNSATDMDLTGQRYRSISLATAFIIIIVGHFILAVF